MKKTIVLLITLLLVLTLCACGAENNNGSSSDNAGSEETEIVSDHTDSDAATSDEKAALSFDGVSAGDTVLFGAYPYSEAGDVESLEWIVLTIEADRALLLTKDAVEEIRYDESVADKITWANCTLRAWLNETFYEDAFSPAEQERILLSHIVCKDNPDFNVGLEEDTEDNVFCISVEEANAYLADSENLDCYPTPYARSRAGALRESGIVDWWLRDPGDDQREKAAVLGEYGIFPDGWFQHSVRTFVRPAVWVQL